MKKTVFDAAIQIRTAAGFGEIIIVVVFLPIFAEAGIEGKMFTPMAATFSIAVLGALILSFTTDPHWPVFFSGKASEKSRGFLYR